jgi:protease-4
MAPKSSLWLTGLYGEQLFIKTLLDKIGVQADILHVGDYKSAGEMFCRTEPSEAAAANIDWLFDGVYDSLTGMIAESRGIDVKKAKRLIDEGPYFAEQATKAGLLDQVEFRDAFMNGIKSEFGDEVKILNRYGDKKGAQFNLANPFAFFSMFSQMGASQATPGKDCVAIVYVEGMILPGHSQPNPFGPSGGAYSGDLRKALEKAAEDDSVKAVVLRVDSPGGSAEASEVIWNAARLLNKSKPLIVSMGNVAASGGYYVSCGADRIFADEMTITASIGVVGGKFVTTPMWDKLGVNWVPVQRGKNADIFNSARPFDEAQRALIQDFMDDTYEVFKQHVKEGRKGKLAKPLDEIAAGRVYTGKQALELGLVDQIGGLADAIRYAADQAVIEDYDVRIIPKPVDFFTAMIEEMSGEGPRPTDISIQAAPGIVSTNSPLLDAALPMLQQLDPHRAKAVLRAVKSLEIIQRDGLALVMPQQIVFE